MKKYVGYIGLTLCTAIAVEEAFEVYEQVHNNEAIKVDAASDKEFTIPYDFEYYKKKKFPLSDHTHNSEYPTNPAVPTGSLHANGTSGDATSATFYLATEFPPESNERYGTFVAPRTEDKGSIQSGYDGLRFEAFHDNRSYTVQLKSSALVPKNYPQHYLPRRLMGNS